jgi:hypothetical protein
LCQGFVNKILACNAVGKHGSDLKSPLKCVNIKHQTSQELAMRTTLDIADDVLFAAKEIARREKKSVGQIISELARSAFNATAQRYETPIAAPGSAAHVSERIAKYGIHPLPARGGLVSNEMIERLRDSEGI